ncbi:hypothetical protein BDV06DRAFT_74484 [Aspergillus oleicola]
MMLALASLVLSFLSASLLQSMLGKIRPEILLSSQRPHQVRANLQSPRLLMHHWADDRRRSAASASDKSVLIPFTDSERETRIRLGPGLPARQVRLSVSCQGMGSVKLRGSEEFEMALGGGALGVASCIG